MSDGGREVSHNIDRLGATSGRYRVLRDGVTIPGEVAAAEEATGRTFYDMVQGMTAWLDKWVRIIAVGVIGVLAFYFVGWYALTSVAVSAVLFYVIGQVYLTGRFEIVDVWDSEALTFSTVAVGRELFRELKKEGGVSPVVSESGAVRYIATKLDVESKVMVTSWVSKLDSFSYHVDMNTHNRLLSLFQENMDWALDKIGYSSVHGKLRAKSVLEAFVGDYDKNLEDIAGKREYSWTPGHPHEALSRVPKNEEGSGDGVQVVERV